LQPDKNQIHINGPFSCGPFLLRGQRATNPTRKRDAPFVVPELRYQLGELSDYVARFSEPYACRL